MNEALKEYATAFEVYAKASKEETVVKLEKQKAYYTFMRAKENLRAEERKLMIDALEV